MKWPSSAKEHRREAGRSLSRGGRCFVMLLQRGRSLLRHELNPTGDRSVLTATDEGYVIYDKETREWSIQKMGGDCKRHFCCQQPVLVDFRNRWMN